MDNPVIDRFLDSNRTDKEDENDVQMETMANVHVKPIGLSSTNIDIDPIRIEEDDIVSRCNQSDHLSQLSLLLVNCTILSMLKST
jgi:hypothetical protein